MPVIFRWNGYRFFFFSNEGNPLEPAHVHVQKGEAIAKFWIDPQVQVTGSYGMNAKELNQLKNVVEEHAELIREKWHEYFKS